MMSEKAEKQVSPIQKEKLEEDCPACGSASVVRDYRRNILVCKNCGRVLREGIKDRSPEWRAYDQEEYEERSRVGPPPTETIHDRGLSTQIDWKNRDAKGNALSPERRTQMHRVRNWQKKTKFGEQKNRNLSMAFSEINRMASQLGIPYEVREIAARTYRKSVEEDLIRGHSIEGIASAALYLACRKTQTPRTLEEMAEVSISDRKHIGGNYRYIARELDLHIPPVNPASYVPRFGGKLNLSGNTRAKAIKLIERAREKEITSGKTPPGIAAGALYIVSEIAGAGKTQREVAGVADITTVTLRNRYKELARELVSIFPECKFYQRKAKRGNSGRAELHISAVCFPRGEV